MPCHYVTGSRGSGKSLYAVTQAFEYFDRGGRVASNLDLYPDERLTDNYRLTRLPDIPSAEHFLSLGLGCDNKYLLKETYDKTKFGLIILDEISLFLTSKKDKEFQPLMDWLVQSRKYGWDLILLAQTKEQVHETVYKALCDNLVLCKSDQLVTIPYIGKLMRSVGLSGRLPDKHTALILNGRSEQNDILETVAYSRQGFSSCYNTSQTFFEDTEYINGVNVDMRSVYSVVPEYILSGQHLIDGLKKDIQHIKDKVKESVKKKDSAMANNHHQGAALKIKFGLIALGLVAFLYFNNPLDNPMLSGITGVEPVPDPVPVAVSSPVSVAAPKAGLIDLFDDANTDYFKKLIRGAEVTMPVYSFEPTLSGVVQVKTDTKLVFVSLADLRVLGWFAVRSDNVVFLRKGKTTIKLLLSQSSYLTSQ